MLKSNLLILTLALLQACSSGDKKTTDSKTDSPVNDKRSSKEILEKEEQQFTYNKPSLEEKLKAAVLKNNRREIRRLSSIILEREPQNYSANFALGMAAYKEKKYGISRIFWEKASKSAENSSAVLNNLAILDQIEGDDSQAIKTLKQSVAKNRSNLVALHNLSKLYLKYNNYKSALVSLELIRNIDDKDFTLINNYGVSLAMNGQAKKAVNFLKQAYSKSDRLVNIGINLVRAYVDAKDYRSAESELIRIEAINSDAKYRNQIRNLRARISSLKSKVPTGGGK
ncbi:MAG: tetratricopeptide repeat protein [Bdellovibrionales bacterium]